MAQSQYRQSLMEIAQIVVDNSEGRARLAFQEEDGRTDKVIEAAHFIKVDGKRVGRDIELYGFLGDAAIGWKQTFVEFLSEVLKPIRSLGLAQSYTAAGERLRQLGHEVYEPKLLDRWDDLFPPSDRVDYSKAKTPSGYICAHCGATGIKLWRGYATVPVTLLCAGCAATEEKKNIDDIDADGKRTDELGQRTDQIGGCIPAVPDEKSVGYWGYTSIPEAGGQWWRRLPTRKK
ncbi:MAG: hypothetical protein MUP45_02395 [Candidatus Marinimicrobia bacterium]|nr:hypothetical protein [Candidatus Neomarinimicrobiota bacterium]